jgi:hypothetical protein
MQAAIIGRAIAADAERELDDRRNGIERVSSIRGMIAGAEHEFSWRRSEWINPWINDMRGIEVTVTNPFARMSTQTFGNNWARGHNNISRQFSATEALVYSEKRTSSYHTVKGDLVLREWLSSRKSSSGYAEYSDESQSSGIRTQLAEVDDYEDKHPSMSEYLQRRLDETNPPPQNHSSDEENGQQVRENSLIYPRQYPN